MASSSTWALGALLVASVGLNYRLYTQKPAPAPRTAPSAAPADTAPRDDGACQARLAACQRQSWEIAARALNNDHPKDDPAPVQAQVPDAGVSPSGPDAQASALCAAAENALRDEWRRDGVLIALNLKRSFGDPNEQEQNVSRALADMKDVANLTPQQATSLEAAYRDKRAAAVAAASAALDRDPPDMGAVVDAARNVFTSEDALLEQFSGPEGRDAWRSHELQSRTTLLALFASLAGKDWDDTIRW